MKAINYYIIYNFLVDLSGWIMKTMCVAASPKSAP